MTFIKEDCAHCGKPEISLEPCPVCKEGFCDRCRYVVFTRNKAGDLVCPVCKEADEET